MKNSTEIRTIDRLNILVRNQELATLEFAKTLDPPRALNEEEVRGTLGPNFWFHFNTLNRRQQHENRSFQPALTPEQEHLQGDGILIHLGYLANASFERAEINIGANVVSLDEFRASRVEQPAEVLVVQSA